MNFLFWNIHKNKKTFPVICSLVISKKIDVLLLAEYPTNIAIHVLLNEMREAGVELFLHKSNNPYKEKVVVISRIHNLIRDKADRPGISIKRLCLENEVLLVVCHLPSKINKSDDAQSDNADEIRQFIEEEESSIGHKRTIVCGDFNMNPFDKGMVKAKGFHAVMEKKIAQKRSRVVGGRNYFFFYNPMWGFLGDLGCGEASGTMYYNSSDYTNFFWHLYDQVLIRPDLISCFNDNDLSIITETNTTNLIVKGVLNKEYSDHLPLSFSLNI